MTAVATQARRTLDQTIDTAITAYANRLRGLDWDGLLAAENKLASLPSSPVVQALRTEIAMERARRHWDLTVRLVDQVGLETALRWLAFQDWEGMR